jgi:adenine-specific DNA-methyltransferase
MAKKSSSRPPKSVEAFKHDEASRKNIPTAEFESVMAREAKTPIQVAIERRNRDLDPQLVWRGKDEKDASDLVVSAPPIYIQEKVHPKALIDDLRRQTESAAKAKASTESGFMPDLFADFNGIPKGADKTEFYQHDANWTNRMILGDSLQVMASLAEREGLRGKVQCIYIDPPYGIKFRTNFQWSTTSPQMSETDKTAEITREPEQVRAFRDTWRDGVHSYLSYLRDRLTIARELLTESGSVFVQIGDENVHRVRAVMDEVFGSENSVAEILVKKKGSQKSSFIDPVNDYILWYSRTPRSAGSPKFRHLFEKRELDSETVDEFSRAELVSGQIVNLKGYRSPSGEVLDFRAYPRRIDLEFPGARLFRPWPITNGGERANQMAPVVFEGVPVSPPKGRCWSHTSLSSDEVTTGMERNLRASRLVRSRESLDFKRYLDDFPYKSISNWWDGFGGAPDQVYVVQTNERIVERCVLMATDPGDLVLDPTCGSGTTAFVAEQWGRRWITIDTSRVALALARARIIGARYPYYLLADSPEGQQKEGSVTQTAPKTTPTRGNLRHGFVYERAAAITSGVVANNIEIDVIWERYQETLEPLRQQLNQALGKTWEEWQIPREAETGWSDAAKRAHAAWWQQRIGRQKEVDASIAVRADTEYLYDRPYEDPKKVRVAGPFTVESLSPHRVLGVDENDELLDSVVDTPPLHGDGKDFATVVLENLKTSGVQQAHKTDKITFTALIPWPGKWIAGEGRYVEADGGKEKRAAIFIGPEFGTVSKPDLTAAAREAGDADFDVLIACAFNYDAHSAEFDKLGRIPVLKARMNADLHMAGDLKNTGKGNLFVIFGEPDIEILSADAGTGEAGQIQVRIRGVDVFHPQTGEVRSDGPEGIACWFIDTDYNLESFFVRHAYFLGANDPYKSLKTTLKAEIDEDAWASLHSDTSRPFEKPKSGRIAVKVINHLGDEVMKVFRVE